MSDSHDTYICIIFVYRFTKKRNIVNFGNNKKLTLKKSKHEQLILSKYYYNF